MLSNIVIIKLNTLMARVYVDIFVCIRVCGGRMRIQRKVDLLCCSNDDDDGGEFTSAICRRFFCNEWWIRSYSRQTRGPELNSPRSA